MERVEVGSGMGKGERERERGKGLYDSTHAFSVSARGTGSEVLIELLKLPFFFSCPFFSF